MFGGFMMLAVIRQRYGNNSPLERRIKGTLRVIGFGLVVSLLLGLVAMRRAQAETSGAVHALAKELEPIADLLADGSSLRINGETVHVAANVVEGSIKDTLDRFEKTCGDADILSLGPVRTESETEGSVLCIARDTKDVNDIAVRIERFARTQDLAALGRMHYALVKKTREGRTQILTAFTDDRFLFSSLAAEPGQDAAGSDSSVVPRLPGSRRLLSAEVVGANRAVRVYTVPGDPKSVGTTLDATMKASGFQRGAASLNERAYLQGALGVVVTLQPTSEGVTVTIAELG